MKYGHITGIEKPISRLIMGTMIYSPNDMLLTCTMLDNFVALGGNTLDTAHVYGGGDAELAVGEWMRLRGNRDEIILIGKGAHQDVQGPRVNPNAIASDLQQSLERMGIDALDLYLLHRDDPAVPVGEIVMCLNEHYHAGRIRAFGGSNWSHRRLQAANDYAHAHGLVPFVASSPNFSLAVMNEPPWSGCISATIDGKDWYTEQQFPLLAWSSQAQGFFTGRAAPTNYADTEMVRVWYSVANFERLTRATIVGKQKGVSANTIALAYVLNQPFPTFALIGPRTNEETRSSMEALNIHLTAEELQRLNLEDDRLTA